VPSSEKLFNDFVDPVISVQEVNIDDKFRKDLEAHLKTPSVDMFDEVQHQVLLFYLQLQRIYYLIFVFACSAITYGFDCTYLKQMLPFTSHF